MKANVKLPPNNVAMHDAVRQRCKDTLELSRRELTTIITQACAEVSRISEAELITFFAEVCDFSQCLHEATMRSGLVARTEITREFLDTRNTLQRLFEARRDADSHLLSRRLARLNVELAGRLLDIHCPIEQLSTAGSEHGKKCLRARLSQLRRAATK
jgi:hypothetical protein